MTDEIDDLLHDYAQRWRAAQPPSPPGLVTQMLAGRALSGRTSASRALAGRATADQATVGRSPARPPARRWAPALAVAAVVALVAVAVGYLQARNGAQPEPGVTASPSISLPAGVIPYVDLPASGVVIPTLSPTPDPATAGAEALPACHAAQLTTQSTTGGAMGTLVVAVSFLPKDGVRCHLAGSPTITPLDPQGRVLPVPAEADDTGFRGAVVANVDDPPSLRITWDGRWCGENINIASLRIELPEGGGTVTTVGFGPSFCSAGDPVMHSPLRYGPIQPLQWEQNTSPRTTFDGVQATISVDGHATAGAMLTFAVTLTAPASADVSLDPCPDYRIGLGTAPPVTGALNCAAVPTRDSAGRPVLRAGASLSFQMRLIVPNEPGYAKLTWQLEVPDPVVAGAEVTIQ